MPKLYKSYNGPQSTPWGKAQTRQEIVAGVVEITTARHGGLWVSKSRLTDMPDSLRSLGDPHKPQFFEEDCAYAAVLLAFDDVIRAEAGRMGTSVEALTDHLRTVVRNYFPDAFEAWSGEKVAPGQSYKRDEEQFFADNAENYVGRSAIRGPISWDDRVPPGVVKVTAVRDIDGDCRKFLVPSDEYMTQGFPFVVDTEKHEALSPLPTA